jgi:hypothetical protein
VLAGDICWMREPTRSKASSDGGGAAGGVGVIAVFVKTRAFVPTIIVPARRILVRVQSMSGWAAGAERTDQGQPSLHFERGQAR